jgi:signal transduction histidine kinase/ligand-binding sensor domain-containing protein/AraC-like DNA-binding protein
MKHTFALLVFMLGLLSSIQHSLNAQNPRLYNSEHGLSSSRINGLYQDRDGFIWIYGENGLDRLVGNHFKRFEYREDIPTSLSNNSINDVFMDEHKQLWIGTGKGLNRFDATTNRFEHIKLSELEHEHHRFSISNIITGDKPNTLLVSTSGHGIYVLNAKTGAVDLPSTTSLQQLMGTSFIGTLLLDNRGWLWAVTSHDGFKVIDLKTKKLVNINQTPEAGNVQTGQLISSLQSDPVTGNMLIGSSSNGLYIFDAAQQRLRKPSDPNLQTKNIQSLLVKKDGTILLGSENRGIWVFDRTTETIMPYDVPNNAQVDLIHSKVHDLMEDNAGNLWAGLYQKGIFIVPQSNSGFEYYAINNNNSGKNRACISAFAKDKQGNLWIATDGGGLFSAKGNDLNDVQEKTEGVACNSMISLAVDGFGTIWAGSYGHGLYCSRDGIRFEQPDYLKRLPNDKIMSLLYDENRQLLYIGTNGERIVILDLKSNQLKLVDAAINKWIRAFHLDKTGRLWVATSEGTFYYDVDRNVLLNADIGIAAYHLTNCFVEYDNTLFIGTAVGLVAYDMKQNKNKVIALGKDNESQNILAMAMGEDQSLWITTTKALSRLNVKTGHLRHYPEFEGFSIGEFKFASVFKDDDGSLLFGGDNGVVRVDPLQVNRQQQQMRPIFFTDLNVNNSFVEYGEEAACKPLDAALLYAEKLRLKYKDNSITLFFSAQEYANPQKVNYSYRLNGYDNTWHHTDASNAKATYASLPPGHYTFEVRGYFDEESSNITSRKLQIVVSHPWYSSILARIIYLLLILTGIYFAVVYYRHKQQQRRILEMARYNEQVKEDKLRLFTSIAHEIRTPLTLIISPLKKLMETQADKETTEMHNLMYRNSLRILQTINQLLDIRKLDNGQLALHFVVQDLNELVKSSMLSFKNMATAKQISFSLESSDSEHLDVWVDNRHFDKIIYNILSNAFKHTPVRGKILIRLSCKDNINQFTHPAITDFVEMRFFNTGEPIETNDLQRIFERFYQGSHKTEITGSGIGLHLTKELVLLHHGHIEAHNIGSEGVEFIVRLPLGNAHLSDTELSPIPAEIDKDPAYDLTGEWPSEQDYVESVDTDEASQEGGEAKNKHTILIVDDDEEFCRYVKKELADYTIITCNSGNKAWKQLLSLHPDVVVTDYLMPDGDGLELCQRIKSNPETDAIPVIILTSEDSESMEMKSIQLHADRFLTKPFNILLLKGAIGQAIRVREKIRKKVQRTEMGFNYDTLVMDSANDKLIKRVVDYIKDHLEDSEMSVEDLSREVGISRVHLNRKLKEILGMSPSALIKSIRLKQAAYLLVNNKVNISEVAYKVGFSSHSYFSYNFHEFFGMSPKEFIIYYMENQDEESIRKLLE